MFGKVRRHLWGKMTAGGILLELMRVFRGDAIRLVMEGAVIERAAIRMMNRNFLG